MSNALKTSKTEFVGLRLPHDVLARAKAIGPNVTQAVIVGLRQVWELPSESPRVTTDEPGKARGK